MAHRGYEHWNEEAERVAAAENDCTSPYADMTDAEIKRAVYERYSLNEDWPDEDV